MDACLRSGGLEGSKDAAGAVLHFQSLAVGLFPLGGDLFVRLTGNPGQGGGKISAVFLGVKFLLPAAVGEPAFFGDRFLGDPAEGIQCPGKLLGCSVCREEHPIFVVHYIGNAVYVGGGDEDAVGHGLHHGGGDRFGKAHA